MMDVTTGILKKLLEIERDFDVVAKKKAEGGGVSYSFQHWYDVQPLLRQQEIDKGVISTNHILDVDYVKITKSKSGTPEERTDCVVKLRIDFECVETGQIHSVFSAGQCMTTDDKCIQKARTQGVKYAMIQQFKIRLEDDDSDEHEAPPLPTFDPKAVADWFLSKEVGGDKATWGAIKQLAGDKSTPNALINEAKVAGCKTRDQVMSYLVEGVAPK